MKLSGYVVDSASLPKAVARLCRGPSTVNIQLHGIFLHDACALILTTWAPNTFVNGVVLSFVLSAQTD